MRFIKKACCCLTRIITLNFCCGCCRTNIHVTYCLHDEERENKAMNNHLLIFNPNKRYVPDSDNLEGNELKSVLKTGTLGTTLT